MLYIFFLIVILSIFIHLFYTNFVPSFIFAQVPTRSKNSKPLTVTPSLKPKQSTKIKPLSTNVPLKPKQSTKVKPLSTNAPLKPRQSTQIKPLATASSNPAFTAGSNDGHGINLQKSIQI